MLVNEVETAKLVLDSEIEVDVRREDLIHETISGNKWRKLYYNLKQAKKRGNDTLLTFGGAFSNHIAATAAAGKENGFKTIGVIRGEEILPLNPTLAFAKSCGMQFHYVGRTLYKQKDSYDFKEYLRGLFGVFYLIPEGGSNYYGTNGCMEVLTLSDNKYSHIAVPAGTGCTAAGIAMKLKPHQKLLVFSSLKGGDFLIDEIRNYIFEIILDDELVDDMISRVNIVTDYHFGGYAKTKPELIAFLRAFNQEHNIKWDAIYNGKMAYGIMDMLSNNYFDKESKLLLIHTGGLQGIKGIENRIGETIY